MAIFIQSSAPSLLVIRSILINAYHSLAGLSALSCTVGKSFGL